MSDYFNGIEATYTFPGQTLSSAAEIGHFVGPKGHVGRLVGVTCAVTTEVTGSAETLSVGSASDADAYGTLSVAVGAADTVANDASILTTDDNVIAADEIGVVSTAGDCTAGAGTVSVHVVWYKANTDVSA